MNSKMLCSLLGFTNTDGVGSFIDLSPLVRINSKGMEATASASNVTAPKTALWANIVFSLTISPE